jgi:hypothetical protein
MNQKAVDYLYEYARGQGYQNPKENFVSLIQTNDEAFNKLYESAKNSGYGNDINAFGLLLGRTPKEQTTTVKEVPPPQEPPKNFIARLLRAKSVDPQNKYRSSIGEALPSNAPAAGELQGEYVTEDVKVTENAPDWLKTKRMFDPFNLIPNNVYYNSVVANKENSDKFDANQQDVVKDLLAIYGSEGYQSKLKNEVEQSKSIGYNTTGGEDKSAAGITLNRVGRVATTPVELKDISTGERGRMKAYVDGNMLYPNATEIEISKKALKNEREGYYTSAEELEHASHIKDSKIKNQSSYNITPYAQKIIDENNLVDKLPYDETDKKYLKDYSEVIAKKRATELFLINNGQLGPGKNVDQKHFNFLIENYDRLPNNVQQFLMISTGMPSERLQEESSTIKGVKTEEAAEKKIEKEGLGVEPINKSRTHYKQNLLPVLENFKTLMNKIAAVDKKDNKTKTG